MATEADTGRESLSHRLRWMSGEGAFYLALASSGLFVVGWVVGFLDAVGGMFTTREPSFRPGYAVAWLLVAASIVASSLGGAAGLRAAREGRRRGWAIAACCVAAIVLPLAGATAVTLLAHPG